VNGLRKEKCLQKEGCIKKKLPPSKRPSAAAQLKYNGSTAGA